MSTSIENKDGTVSPFGFDCGYQELYGDWLGENGVRLFKEHTMYHVRGIVKEDGLATFVWEVYPFLKDAREAARRYGEFQQP